MPRFKVSFNSFVLTPDQDDHMESISDDIRAMGWLQSDGDVVFHCKSNRKVQASRILLASASNFFKSMFCTDCTCSTFIPFNYVVLCPDLSATAIKSVLDLFFTGKTKSPQNQLQHSQLVSEMSAVINCFRINIPMNYLEHCLASAESDAIKVCPEFWSDSLIDNQSEPCDPDIKIKIETSSNMFDDDDFFEEMNEDDSQPDQGSDQGSDQVIKCQEPKIVSLPKKNTKVKPQLVISDHQNSSKSVSQKDTKEQFEPKSYICYICGEPRHNLPTLKMHIACVHFKNETKKFVTEDGLGCKICGKKTKTKVGVFSHLRNAHRGLENISSLLIGHGSRPKIKPKNGIPHQCHLCPKELTNYLSLLRHHGIVHFRDLVMSPTYAKDNVTCNLCDRALKNNFNLVQHLVTFHRVLKDKVPERKKVPRKRRSYDDYGEPIV